MVKDKVIYQIYPKSFADSNADGIGDLQGILAHLDYLAWLGVDYLWITPFFLSPMRDNGYDVADYFCINPMFGTMEDLEELIRQAEERGIGLMLDMVFNHTSTEHEWFRRALAGEKKYQDYYIFRSGTEAAPPTNWQSKFGGSAWEYVPALKKWYLHLFDTTQADLNWDNPEVREELKKVVRFWKQKGIKGFRFDVVNLISKPRELCDDPVGDGRQMYTDGPHVHEYLKELVRDTDIGDMVTVGEMSSTSIGQCARYADPRERELSMCFHFHHLKVDYKDGSKWELMPPDLEQLKKLFMDWQLQLQEAGSWEALFWCNHDQPRIVSRLGDEGAFWKESAKMLATCIHLLRGTPYIYQGEELGMMNPGYDHISDYRDVESLNYHRIMQEQGKTEEEVLEILRHRSRDNGRTPMQWSNGQGAGFTEGAPWLNIPENYREINMQTEMKDPDSILHYYRRLIALRKQCRAVAEGTVAFLYADVPRLFAYERCSGDQKICVLNNLTGTELKLPEALELKGYRHVLGNYPWDKPTEKITELRQYESVVLLKQSDSGR